jgi:hypothetical protein
LLNSVVLCLFTRPSPAPLAALRFASREPGAASPLDDGSTGSQRLHPWPSRSVRPTKPGRLVHACQAANVAGLRAVELSSQRVAASVLALARGALIASSRARVASRADGLRASPRRARYRSREPGAASPLDIRACRLGLAAHHGASAASPAARRTIRAWPALANAGAGAARPANAATRGPPVH